jgi:hypothetical protein
MPRVDSGMSATLGDPERGQDRSVWRPELPELVRGHDPVDPPETDRPRAERSRRRPAGRITALVERPPALFSPSNVGVVGDVAQEESPGHMPLPAGVRVLGLGQR